MNLGHLAWNTAVSRNSRNTGRQDEAISRLTRKGSLVVNLTTRCNFSCKHCMRSLANPKDFPFDLLEKIVVDAKKFKFQHMSLTGGEPLLYPKIRECVALLAKNGYAFNIATNGFILEDFFDLFRQNKKNIQFIQFSLEDADPKKHDGQRRAGSFKKILECVQFCRNNKIPFRFMTAASTANIKNIFDIALFAKKKGALGLAITTVLPCPRSKNNNLVLGEEERNLLFLNAIELSSLLRFPVTLTSAIRTQEIIRFCSGLSLNEIAFDVEGNVIRCCDLANFDDEAIRKKALITSANGKTFEEILLRCSEHVKEFDVKRIKDYTYQTNPNSVNFNSCFYCLDMFKNNV